MIDQVSEDHQDAIDSCVTDYSHCDVDVVIESYIDWKERRSYKRNCTMYEIRASLSKCKQIFNIHMTEKVRGLL